MTIVVRLGVTSANSSQAANKELAKEITSHRDERAVTEIFAIATNQAEPRSGSAINVIGEVASRAPSLIAPYVDQLVSIASGATGLRLWESTGALAAIARYQPELLEPHWRAIVRHAHGDSVIARDNAVKVLCALTRTRIRQDVVPVLMNVLESAPVNQFPSYAEQIADIATEQDRDRLHLILEQRVGEMPNAAKSRRVNKVLQRIS